MSITGSKFNVIVADPPWMYQKNSGINGPGDGAPGIAEREYPTMTGDQIASLPVSDLAADDAHVFMWTTNPKMFGGRHTPQTAAELLAAWGFEFRTLLTWVKTTKVGEVSGGGMGHYFRGATEHIAYGTRGRARIEPSRRLPNVIMAPATGHSRKPEAFFDLVEATCDGPYLELFARRPRLGWSAWGNEFENDVALSVPSNGPSRIGSADVLWEAGWQPGSISEDK